MRKSLRIHSTAKPKSNLPSLIVFQRFSICHDCAAPFEIVSMTVATSRPALRAKFSASARPCTTPAIAIWLTIFVSWPEPAGPISRTACANERITGSAVANGSASPPTMTVSLPFSAPAWPPDTGASRQCTPRFLPAAAISRATSAEAVV